MARRVAADIAPFEARFHAREGAHHLRGFAQEGQAGIDGVVVERHIRVGARPEAPEASVAATDIEQALSAAQQGKEPLPAGPGLAPRAREIGRVLAVEGAVDGQEAVGGVGVHRENLTF